MNLSNLPPGVTNAMIEQAAGGDDVYLDEFFPNAAPLVCWVMLQGAKKYGPTNHLNEPFQVSILHARAHLAKAQDPVETATMQDPDLVHACCRALMALENMCQQGLALHPSEYKEYKERESSGSSEEFGIG